VIYFAPGDPGNNPIGAAGEIVMEYFTYRAFILLTSAVRKRMYFYWFTSTGLKGAE
jgi:hypothetical protein